MKSAWLILITSFILQACQQGSEREASVQLSPDSISTTLPEEIEVKRDAVYLRYLDSLFEHQLIVETAPDSGEIDQPYHLVPQRFDFTGDGEIDYLKLSSIDHRFVMGHIIDGATGRMLDEWNEHYGVMGMDSILPLALFFNRPDHSRIETRVVDVNCEDHQKELLVICDNAFVQMEGPTSYCAIFRYDAQTESLKSIFEHRIEFHPSGSGLIGPDGERVNYLDVLYEDKPCLDSIWIRNGYALKDSSSGGILDYKLIRPGRGEPELYLFNKQENVFEEADVN